uniref:LIM zinc-binding domain-containing protein n=1 Tax=Kryptolebias marmoratus TaxID=37003 RepID=A0A3Q3B2Q4_KRYMA
MIHSLKHRENPLSSSAVQCSRCGRACRGEVLRVQSSYFHIKCFTCKVCGCDLAHSGFFVRNGDCLCPVDFQRLHGTPCNNCGEFVEGEVVTVLGKSYHPACFACTVLEVRATPGLSPVLCKLPSEDVKSLKDFEEELGWNTDYESLCSSSD